jgi:anti-sigma factor RsiW
VDDEKLMLFLDGELDRDDARKVERAIAASPELAAKAKALGQLRDVVAARYEAAADEAAPALDALWEKILPGLGPAPAAARPERRSFWVDLKDWIEGHRSHLVTGAVAAAAGALIATFAAGSREPRVVERYVYAPPATSVLASTTPAEVESLEVMPAATATILQIPGDREDDPATTVIWITPNEEGPT